MSMKGHNYGPAYNRKYDFPIGETTTDDVLRIERLKYSHERTRRS